MYKRVFELTAFKGDEVFKIEAVDGRQLRVVFDITHDINGARTTANIAIYNLSRTTESKIKEDLANLTLKAGYVDNFDFIFSGEIVNVLRERKGADTVTRLYCLSSKTARNKASINKTLSEGAKPTQAIRACIDAMGLIPVMKDSDFADLQSFRRGKTLNGDPRTLLDGFKDSFSFGYSIVGGKCIVVRDGKPRNSKLWTVGMESGMVGVPEVTEVGTNVVTLLNPAYGIGELFEIDTLYPDIQLSAVYYQDVSRVYRGKYKIISIVHKGDNYGEAWTTKLQGLKYGG